MKFEKTWIRVRIRVRVRIRHIMQIIIAPDAGFTAESISTFSRPRRRCMTSSKMHPQIAIHYIGILGWLRSMGEPL